MAHPDDATAAAMSPGPSEPTRWRFADGQLFWASRLFGIAPDRAWCEVDESGLRAVFGRWSVETELGNVAAVSTSGPYHWWKVAGPPRLSFADRGLTFGTDTREGVCVQFHRPVPGIEPLGLLRHPGVTLTLEDPEGFRRTLQALLDRRARPDQ
jgi:hypothetical protein